MVGRTTLTIRNADSFGRGLEVEARRIGLRASRRLEVLARYAADRARELCPVRTGRLRASIFVELAASGPLGATWRFGTRLDYAGYVEYGTSRAAAQPYLRPAIAAARARGLF